MLDAGIRRRTLLTFAWVTPVASPKSFDFEAMAFVSVFFGGRPSRAPLTPPPLVGGY